MSKNLVIVESPAKAKTIEKFLGPDYVVKSSIGHIRDMPKKDMGVNIENDFLPTYAISSDKKKVVADLKKSAKSAEKIFLATDEDREGEAIAWHLQQALSLDSNTPRIVFHEITKGAITEAIKNPRTINTDLVDAQQARRIIDRLVGFEISPVLWRKISGARSAGRVQSPVVRLVVEREREISAHNPISTFKVKANLTNKNNQNLEVKLSKEFSSKEDALFFAKALLEAKLIVDLVETKPSKRSPKAPFITSTLQQEASQKLGFSVKQTMSIAQNLYREGAITYMRTDGTNISKDAVNLFRDYINNEFGKIYLPIDPLSYSGKKAKNAQEAHEAIRPTDIKRTPDSVKKYLSADQLKLYNLIWSRALSSQMESAKFDRNTIVIQSNNGKNIFKATGSVIKFDGFLKLYNLDDENKDEKILPNVEKGEVNFEKFIDEQHFTQPPPRFSEASLVKKLEELGIGRPSTYASIISVIVNRGYAEIINKRFFPTDRGKLISAFLEKLFSKYVDYNFTASLEDQLDEITTGKESWIKVLELFWKDFNNNVSEVKEKRTREVLDLLNDSLGDLVFDKDNEGNIVRKCQLCSSGILSLKNSFRGGAFIGCSNYPECKFTRPLSKAKAAAQAQLAEPKFIGKHENGNDIYLKNGRFGPYLQYEKILADVEVEKVTKKKKKTKKLKSDVNELLKNVSIPKGLELESIDLEKAQFLCSLPKSLGINPDNQKEITLNTGRFGPYLKCENKSARIENIEEIFSIGLNRAITLIAEAKPGRMSSSIIKDLGEHPEDKKPVRVMKGQYGPYIKYKSLNATIPEEKDPTELTMEEALILIEKRKEYDKTKKSKKRKSK